MGKREIWTCDGCDTELPQTALQNILLNMKGSQDGIDRCATFQLCMKCTIRVNDKMWPDQWPRVAAAAK